MTAEPLDEATTSDAATAPNFLAKLWKSRQQASALVPGEGAADAALETQSLEQSGSGIGIDISSMPLGSQNGAGWDRTQSTASSSSPMTFSPTEESLNSGSTLARPDPGVDASQFLSKLWKAQKRSDIRPASFTTSKTEDFSTEEASAPSLPSTADPSVDETIVVEATPSAIATEESLPVEAAEVQTLAASTPNTVIAESGQALNQQDASLTGETGEIGETVTEEEITSPEADRLLLAATERISAATDAQTKRKIALELYEQLKAEQKLKTERAKNEAGLDDSSKNGDTSLSEQSIVNETESLKRSSFASAPEPGKPLAVKPSTFGKHPIIWITAAAAIAALAVYIPENAHHTATTDLDSGKTLLSRGDPRGAITKLNQAIRSDRTLGAAYVARGEANIAVGDQVAALADFNQALTLNPKDVNALAERASLQVSVGRFRKAIADFEQISREQGTLSADLLSGSGLAYFGDGQYTTALKQFSKRLDRKPEDSQTLLHRAACYQALNQLHRAIDDCDHAIKLKDLAYEALVLKARCEGQLASTSPADAKNTDALANFNKAITGNSTRPEAFTYRGSFYAKQGKFKQALSDYDQAIERKGGTDTYYEKAKTLALMGAKGQALEQFKQLEARSDFNKTSWFLIQRSDVYFDAGNYKQAIADLKAAQVLDGAYLTTVWLKMAACYEALKDYKTAESLTAKVLAEEPGNSLALIKQIQPSFRQSNDGTRRSFQSHRS